MQTEKNQYRSTLFPTKESVFSKLPRNSKQIQLVSNHFPVKFQNNFKVTEWYMKIFKALNEDNEDQNKMYLKNPNSIKNEIQPDARKEIQRIYGSNKKQIYQKLGKVVISGQQLFSFSQSKLEFLLFDNNEEYSIGLEKKNENISSNDLFANSHLRLQFLRFLNIKVKNLLFEQKLFEFGRTKQYYQITTQNILKQSGLEIYQGSYYTFEVYEGGLKMLSDISSRVLQNKNLWDQFKEYLGVNNDKKAIQASQFQIEKFFNGLNVITNYGNSFRRYRIEGIRLDLTPQSAFPDKKKYKSYNEYYLNEYKIKINVQNQFLLSSTITDQQNGEKIIKYVELVPELLKMTGMTHSQKKNHKVMQDVSKYTIVNPDKRVKDIYQNIDQRINQKTKDINIQINDNQITGIQLQKPSIMKGKKSFQLKEDRIRINEVYKQMEFSDWTVVYDFKIQKIDQIINAFQESAKRYKFVLKKPKMLKLPKEDAFAQNKAKDFVEQFHNEEINQTSIILYIVSSRISEKLYDQVKKFYQKLGIPTQFYDSFNEYKDLGNLSKISNILLQMNNKMGGRSHLIQNDFAKDTMVIGMESSIVNLEKSKRAAVCICCQHGPNFQNQTSYATSNKIEKIQKIEIQKLDKVIISAVKDYKKKYKKLPVNIIFYRMGLSDMQTFKSIENELIPMKKVLYEEFQEQRPNLIFIIVNKKINDRFFSLDNKNVEGVAVLNEVTRKDKAEFFLIPQKVNRGTATPSLYSLIDMDQSKLKLENLIEITYNLTYDYLNWAGPIRVPSVLQNALKLSNQISQIKTDSIAKNLKNVPFYL